ncbi:tetratricopeptide repeat-containing sulfotransferase family protein [Vulcaniibacterium gelatinicum]|uniref:tetratricopeptide repeat-containing sulfotransferase family protein n=1 Tax=Vulcaniibacterium gelatinicum TaxID=2598725 RepID=UPI0011CC4A66|nr:tetratricopeptide repeat-containing sulfotransferase family protein [Vulcaniibacterium gelatinicum]
MSAPAPTASPEVALAHAARLLGTDPALAGEQAQEILRVLPGHPPAQLILAASHTACGAPERALALLEPLVHAHPHWPQAQFELGLALGRAGQGDAAVAALRRAVALKPDLPRAWLALADHLAAIGDEAGADAARTQYVRHSVRDPQLLRAADALAGNRLPEAEALLRAHLRQAPTDVAAIRMLAEVAARLGRVEDAEALLERCLELAPGFHAARQNYAQVLHRANKPQEALAQVERLLAHDPANASYRNLKAVILCRTGDYAPALALYDGILAEYPGHPRIWLSYGHALKTAGETARAIAAYRRAIALDPAFGEAWWSLANLKTFRFEPADLEAMRAALARGDLPDEHRLHLEFALGKALEDAAEYAASFEHYARGNALRRRRVPYDADETAARVQRARTLYTREFFAARAGWGAPDPDPIFVVGLPRAGSTLVEQILSSHPQVEGTMELPEVISITRELRRRAAPGQTYHDVLATLGADALRALGERYLARTRVHRKRGAPLFVDKMPNNFAHVGLIRLMLPNAKIVDARRHPLACCFSAFKQHFARGQDFSYSLEDLGRYYRDYVALMAHFDAVLPGHVHRVIYERMVEDTEAEVRRLLDYCGLPFDPRCLRFFENDRPVRTASSEQVRRPIYREGLDHWRHYEPWLGPLKAALGRVLDTYPDVPDESSGTSPA